MKNLIKITVLALSLRILNGPVAMAASSPSSVKKTPEKVVALTLQDHTGLKIEIIKQVDKKDLSPKHPAPAFPDDLTVSDKLDEKKTWLAWNPSGANDMPLSNECRQEALRDLLWKDKAVFAQGAALNERARHCRPSRLQRLLKPGYYSLVRLASVNYSFLENPHIHHVKATLADGRVLDGFIAMKPGPGRRPFVIAKCGVFCNAQHSVMHRSFMMHLFDESPFHVLALANNTGSDFQINNKAVSLGGFDEGRQLYQIAQLVGSQDSPIRGRISSVHVVGASLGGAAALYSGLYASLNDSPGKQSIQSVTAACPVVVLDNSIKALYYTKPISTLASFETMTQIRDIFNFVPIVGRYFPINTRRMRGPEIYENLTSATFNYYQDWTQTTPWDLKPFEGVRIDTLDQFWYLNDFRNFVSQTTVPTLVLSADNDGLVQSKLNSRLLADTLKKTPNPQVSTVFFPWGSHCAFALENGWAIYSTLLREYILTHAPESGHHWQMKKVNIPAIDFDLREREQLVDVIWRARIGSDRMELGFKIFSPYGKLRSVVCSKRTQIVAKKMCYRTVRAKLPLNILPFEFYQIPRTRYEVTSLTRFANTRFSLWDEEGKPVVNSRRQARSVSAWVWK